MKILTGLLALISLTSANKTPGCDIVQPPHRLGKSTHHNLTMVDPATNETLTRDYTVKLPANYIPGTEYPVVFWFHGWYDDPTYWPFVDVGQKNNVITVYPLGMSDVEGVKPDDHSGISWNVGDAGNTATCS